MTRDRRTLAFRPDPGGGARQRGRAGSIGWAGPRPGARRRGAARTALAALALSLLTACGVDGPPQPPEPRDAPTVTLSGSAGIGVTGG